MILLIIVCILWLLFVIITNKKSKNKISNINNFKHINNTSSVEGIIYPVHIKYKMLEKNEILYPTNVAYSNNVKTAPKYNCIIDNEIVSAISMGQETEIDVTPGEHVIFFETKALRNKS